MAVKIITKKYAFGIVQTDLHKAVLISFYFCINKNELLIFFKSSAYSTWPSSTFLLISKMLYRKFNLNENSKLGCR